MNFCSNCGKNMEGTNFCSNCGQTSVSAAQSVIQGQNTNQVSNNSLPKDNLGLAGFICGIIGFLCCTYVAIPGLICSIMSIINVRDGKVDAKNKWMGIVGVILSGLGLLFLIINIIGIAKGTNDIFNSIKELK